MPTVQQFYASGKGNGFPFCLEKVNVADKGDGTPYDYWTTLGGYNKEDADADIEVTPEQISLSLQNAWRLHWMFYRIDAYNEFDSGGTVNDFLDVDGNSERTSGSLLFWGEPDPKDRVCRSSDGFGGYGNSIFQTLPTINTIAIAFQFMEDKPLAKMYNEGSFVGYGVFLFNGNLSATITAQGAGLKIYSGAFGCSVQLASYGNTPSINSGEIVDLDYVTFGGISFLCCAWSRYLRSGVGGTADAATLSASWERSVSSFYETRLDSIEFYTTA